MRKLSREELAWAAGLFEGEGCFSLHRPRNSAIMQMNMTDEDVVRRFAEMFNIGVYGPYRVTSRPESKPFWAARTASFEKVQAVGAMLWPWLGIRRKAQFKRVMGEHIKYRDGKAL